MSQSDCTAEHAEDPEIRTAENTESAEGLNHGTHGRGACGPGAQRAPGARPHVGTTAVMNARSRDAIRLTVLRSSTSLDLVFITAVATGAAA